MWKCTSCRKRTGVKSDTCPKCGRWATLIFDGSGAVEKAPARDPARRGPQRASEVRVDARARFSTGLAQWDHLLTGGFVAGQRCLLAGEPGCGKTTALLAMAGVVAGAMGGEALYISSEQQEIDLASYAKRIGCRRDNLLLWHSTDVEEALEEVGRLKPKFVVWDSLQRFRAGHYAPKSDAAMQILVEGASRFVGLFGPVQMFVSQVGKDNYAACGRWVDHDIDTVIYIEPKAITVDKNRQGVGARSVPREIPGLT